MDGVFINTNYLKIVLVLCVTLSRSFMLLLIQITPTKVVNQAIFQLMNYKTPQSYIGWHGGDKVPRPRIDFGHQNGRKMSNNTRLITQESLTRPKFVDLGSGDGRIVVAAALAGYEATGIEVLLLTFDIN